MPLYLYKYSLKDKFYTMKKLLLFFSKPIVGGILSLIGLLEILFSIPSSYITYPIPLWIIVLSSFICLALQIPQRRRRVSTSTAEPTGGCLASPSSPMSSSL